MADADNLPPHHSRTGRELSQRYRRRSYAASCQVLSFAADDWETSDGVKAIPKPRTIDELRADPEFRADAADAVVATVPFRVAAEAAE